MKFDAAYFDQIIDRRNTDCEKWDDRGIMDANGIPLWVADMDFPCSPAIVNALQERAKDVPLCVAGCVRLPQEKARTLYALLYELLDQQKKEKQEHERHEGTL